MHSAFKESSLWEWFRGGETDTAHIKDSDTAAKAAAVTQDQKNPQSSLSGAVTPGSTPL